MPIDKEKEKRLKIIEAKAIAYMRGKKEDCFVKEYLMRKYQKKIDEQKNTPDVK